MSGSGFSSEQIFKMSFDWSVNKVSVSCIHNMVLRQNQFGK